MSGSPHSRCVGRCFATLPRNRFGQPLRGSTTTMTRRPTRLAPALATATGLACIAAAGLAAAAPAATSAAAPHGAASRLANAFHAEPAPALRAKDPAAPAAPPAGA